MAVALQSCGDDRIVIDNSLPQPDVDPDSEYIAVFGDIQYLTMPTTVFFYRTQVEWLERNIALGAKIGCVLHTGDITETNDPVSWVLWHGETENLAKETLYMSAIGDHDYTWHDKVYISDRSDTHFSEYMDFPATLDKVVARFEPGKMENVVVENHIRGERYDLLCLEFGPRNEVVEWANEYVSSHPDIKFILI
ncbi:MAG: metallophosphoesterase, partial [Bacteroidales bacterium]|nr:metallophosphoesterase [Bacteroidales bacterium]